jgi:hypothetical protein
MAKRKASIPKNVYRIADAKMKRLEGEYDRVWEKVTSALVGFDNRVIAAILVELLLGCWALGTKKGPSTEVSPVDRIRAAKHLAGLYRSIGNGEDKR